MFKKIRRILSFFSRVDDKIVEITILIDDFEKAYEDKKLELDEVISLLLQFLKIFKSLISGFRK